MFFALYGSGSQTDNFCYECHKGEGNGSVQVSPPDNYNYSRRASGDASITCPSNILEAFSFIDDLGISQPNCGSDPGYGTSHNLADITNFIKDMGWGYTADSNPCTACHNPHLAQYDDHTPDNRGWLVSLPSTHTAMSTWHLWGDDAGERMDQYPTLPSIYQAPNAASEYEPESSTTQDGSNLTDYVTFCTDCHNSTNDIWSTRKNDYLVKFDWNVEKHGGGDATNDVGLGDPPPDFIDVKAPYDQDTRYVLACTDCHEPHGSSNIFLIREKVNSGDVTVLTGDGLGPDGKSAKEWMYLCEKCHDGLLQDNNHTHPGCLPPDEPGQCCSSVVCHSMHVPPIYRPCGDCHYHGNTDLHCDTFPMCDGYDYGDYGELLF
jgi:hypothetical protein